MSGSTYKAIVEIFIIYVLSFFVYVGVSVVIDLILGEPITQEVIIDTLWKAPFMAIIFTIINRMRSVIDEEVKPLKVKPD